MASYEEKQREVLQENRDLRSALESLQAEHRAIVNQQVPASVPESLSMQLLHSL